MNKLLFDSGRDDYYLILAAFSRLDQTAHAYFSRETIFFSLLVAFQKFVYGANPGDISALKRRGGLQCRKIVVFVKIMGWAEEPFGSCVLGVYGHIKSVMAAFVVQFQKNSLFLLWRQPFSFELIVKF